MMAPSTVMVPKVMTSILVGDTMVERLRQWWRSGLRQRAEAAADARCRHRKLAAAVGARAACRSSG